jgi:hypothetical protein
MNTTPLWVPLVVAALGLLGTVIGAISGVVITQRRADKREAVAWEREQERERAIWARDDARRTFEHRRTAYAGFYQSLTRLGTEAFDRMRAELAASEVIELERRLELLELYATPRVTELATTAYLSIGGPFGSIGQTKDRDELPKHRAIWLKTVKELLRAMREDLRVPND